MNDYAQAFIRDSRKYRHRIRIWPVNENDDFQIRHRLRQSAFDGTSEESGPP